MERTQHLKANSLHIRLCHKKSVKVNYKYMIVDFDISFNNYNKMVLNNYGLWKYHCPSCNSKNSLIRHGVYNRNICIFIENAFVESKISVLRLRCTSCGTTHAILPSDTIPYCFFSFPCVIATLNQYYLEEIPVKAISNKFSLSYQMIYIFLSKFLLKLLECISFLRVYLSSALSFNTSPSTVLRVIKKTFEPRDFLKHYFHHTKKIFLMNRRRYILSDGFSP